MTSYTFEILGNTPSKKNQKQIIHVKGKPIIISSKRHNEWHKDASIQLLQHKRKINDGIMIDFPIKISLGFYAPNKRKYDLDNRASTILDLLVDGQIIVDDTWNIVQYIEIKHLGIDTKKARCIVTIDKLS